MSKEFEEIVLKKLDGLETGLKDTQQELKGVKKELKSLSTKVDKLETQVDNLETKVDKLETQVDNLETKVGKLDMEVKDTGEVVNYLNQNFTKFDYEINKKIDTLFDAFTTNKESDSIHEMNIVSLNAKVFNHDIRISNLEDKIITV